MKLFSIVACAAILLGGQPPTARADYQPFNQPSPDPNKPYDPNDIAFLIWKAQAQIQIDQLEIQYLVMEINALRAYQSQGLTLLPPEARPKVAPK